MMVKDRYCTDTQLSYHALSTHFHGPIDVRLVPSTSDRSIDVRLVPQTSNWSHTRQTGPTDVKLVRYTSDWSIDVKLVP